MMQRLKQDWQEFKTSPPGKRFQNLHRRRNERGGQQQPWFAIVGVALMIVGVLLLLLPGPGVIFLAAGLALFAQEMPFVARFLDALELRLGRWFGRRDRPA